MARRVLAFVLLTVALSGCQGSTVDVDAYPTMKHTSVDCVGLLGDLPPKVAGQSRRRVRGNLAGAWGDPPIILRCGVEKPAALRPNSRCDVVNGVGWFSEHQSDGWLFTAIGRRHYVSLEVPKDYNPASDALADVADLVERHLPVTRPCA